MAAGQQKGIIPAGDIEDPCSVVGSEFDVFAPASWATSWDEGPPVISNWTGVLQGHLSRIPANRAVLDDWRGDSSGLAPTIGG